MSIIKKPFVVLILLFIVIASLIQFLNYKVYINKKEQHINSKVELIQEHYDVSYKTFKKHSSLFYKAISSNKKIINILKNANSGIESKKNEARKNLAKKFSTKYKLISKLGVDLIQFHLPNNESFFRRHKQNKFGDNLTSVRYSLAQTNRLKIPHEGLEAGIYKYAFRFVFPIFDETKKHIGSVEGSVSSLAFIEYFERVSRIHTHFIIKKDKTNLNKKELIKNYIDTR